ncbi:DUF11 domain-containing protein [Streptomyces sp. QL37]|uniref:DUF11 domain-containing protein n=1 Tax=Streptomyces sp. QL37 TaxID=2093747 RepID=UPI0021CB756A|nr:DUF11 domain-containing protein [Streptomyces sp. QL37]
MKKTLIASAAALGALATVTGPAAAPAAAASDALWLWSDPYEITLAGPSEDGSPAPSQSLTVQISHDNTATTVPTGTLTVDASGVASFAEVTWPANCRPENETTAVCTTPELPGGANAPAARIGLTTKPGATDGNDGYVRYTAQAGGMNAYPGETYVAVNDGPALGLTQAEYRTGMAPDQPFDSPVVLGNQGNRTADRTLLTVFTSRGIRLGMSVPSNCESTNAVTGRTFLCVLDERTTPGSYHSLPLKFRTKDMALFDRVDYSAQPYSEQALAEARAGRAFTPGAGPELNLTPAAAPSDELQPYRSFTVKTVNQADYRLTASTVSGAAGDTVPAAVTVHNAGPAWVASLGAGEPAATVDIDIPAGTSVASAPDACWSQSETRYRCNTPIYLTESGKPATHTFPFTLHIDEVIPNATARAAIYNDAYEPAVRTFDPDLTNNTATLTVNPSTS